MFGPAGVELLVTSRLGQALMHGAITDEQHGEPSSGRLIRLMHRLAPWGWKPTGLEQRDGAG